MLSPTPMLAEQAGWKVQTFNWFGKTANKYTIDVRQKNDEKCFLKKRTDRERKKGQKRER